MDSFRPFARSYSAWQRCCPKSASRSASGPASPELKTCAPSCCRRERDNQGCRLTLVSEHKQRGHPPELVQCRQKLRHPCGRLSKPPHRLQPLFPAQLDGHAAGSSSRSRTGATNADKRIPRSRHCRRAPTADTAAARMCDAEQLDRLDPR